MKETRKKIRKKRTVGLADVSQDSSNETSSGDGKADTSTRATRTGSDEGGYCRGNQGTITGGCWGRGEEAIAVGGHEAATCLSDSRKSSGHRDNVDLIVGSGGEADLGHGQGGAENGGSARTRDCRASFIGARDDSGDIKGDRGDDRDSGCGGRHDVCRDGGIGGDTGVASHVGSAYALEENDSLRDDLVGLTVCVDAVENVLDKNGVGAEAGGIRVVRTANAEEEGVQARRDNAGAGQGLDGGDRCDGRRRLDYSLCTSSSCTDSRNRLGGCGILGRVHRGSLNWGLAGHHRGECGSHRTDGG